MSSIQEILEKIAKEAFKLIWPMANACRVAAFSGSQAEPGHVVHVVVPGNENGLDVALETCSATMKIANLESLNDAGINGLAESIACQIALAMMKECKARALKNLALASSAMQKPEGAEKFLYTSNESRLNISYSGTSGEVSWLLGIGYVHN